MKSFTMFINNIPFSGKVVIRPLAFNFYHSVSLKERFRSYVALIALLLFYILAHGVQALMGLELVKAYAPTWAKVIGTVYAVINLCVTLVQIHLVYRVTCFFRRGLFPRLKRHYVDYSISAQCAMVCFTLAGQLVFLFPYLAIK